MLKPNNRQPPIIKSFQAPDNFKQPGQMSESRNNYLKVPQTFSKIVTALKTMYKGFS
jgi:hypothetical protein